MKNRRYAIVDIETTGGRATRDKITEIGIVLHDGEKILDTYETLVNPECYIPTGITRLTGISQDMVKDAPKFFEVAREVVKMTEGAIFVAHNVRFDYNFIREEFARLGFTFTRRRLCTVRLSRKTFPGLKSYSLENLIRHFQIPVDARHRALADARATTVLLEKVLEQEENHEKVKLLVNMGIQESRLPQGIDLDKIHGLPEACGVYYLHNAAGQVIYVGKSINIKKRIAEHFADRTKKGQALQGAVADISYELTGSEMIALLLESHEIKRLKPPINRAKRRMRFSYAIKMYENEDGFVCFDVVRNTAEARKKHNIISEYPSMSSAKGRLNHMVKKYSLCARFCHLHYSKGPCFHYHLKQCLGACAQKESAEEYNVRARGAVERLNTIFDDDFLLFDAGREEGEHAVVMVEHGRYVGFGYISADDPQDIDSLRGAIKPHISTPDMSRIIQRFMSDHPQAKCIKLV